LTNVNAKFDMEQMFQNNIATKDEFEAENDRTIAGYKLLWNKVKEHGCKYWAAISREICDQPHATSPQDLWQRWRSAGFK
jgi:hypothetical protein